ncbi:hypothetical protein MTR67_020085 [Solanum verrucosum]|uniref:Uncharacterized protein n=1 Tax=Solanum verrucosum TaxID=315347 RepID=A0AAF0QT64_SOLVR|nr:hypothetical protein MTR67_020085 [Solanum verrucosum]
MTGYLFFSILTSVGWTESSVSNGVHLQGKQIFKQDDEERQKFPEPAYYVGELTSNLEGSNFSGLGKILGSRWIDTTSKLSDHPFLILHPEHGFKESF